MKLNSNQSHTKLCVIIAKNNFSLQKYTENHFGEFEGYQDGVGIEIEARKMTTV